MIIVVLIVGFLSIWIFIKLVDFNSWLKRQSGKRRQKELEAKNTEPLLGFEKCSPQFQAYMRGEIEAGRAEPKTEPQGNIEDATYDDGVHYGERGGRYRYRYNRNGEPYRDYF